MKVRARLRAFPLGVVGHWPAGNIEIQPILSLTCALLGGNSCLVRVPTGLVDPTRLIMERLLDVDREGLLSERIFMATFDHSRVDLHEAMARTVDGAMIWGGAEAVSQVRALPFPHWARLAVFGPRAGLSRRWIPGLGAIPPEGRVGAKELHETFGSSISRPVRRRRHCFSSAVMDVIRPSSLRASAVHFMKRTARIREPKSRQH